MGCLILLLAFVFLVISFGWEIPFFGVLALITACFAIGIIIIKYTNKETEIKEHDKLREKNFYATKSEIYRKKQPVTGDYYTKDYLSFSNPYLYPCSDTSNCPYCCRRKETAEINGYSYGPSNRCAIYYPYD